MNQSSKDFVLKAHLMGRIHTLDLLASIADNYDDCEGPEAIRRAAKLIRDIALKQASDEGIKLP